MADSIEKIIANPAWQRLLNAARRKLERTHGELDGSVGIANPTDAERRVIIGIDGRYRSTTAATLRVNLSEVDRSIRDAHGVGLLTALALRDGPVRDRPAERADEATAKTAALNDADRRCRAHRDEPWFRRWLETLAADGTATRLIRGGEADQLGWAAEVLNRLPANGTPLPVLAEWATGNTKALSGTAVATLVLRALTVRDNVPMPTNAEQRRALWESASVVVDDLASQILVLNLPAAGDSMVAGWLRDAADTGIPFRITLHQLTTAP